jgi:hypothetical protein
MREVKEKMDKKKQENVELEKKIEALKKENKEL